MSTSTLSCEVREGVARVRFDRPEALNSIDADMAREFRAIATRCAQDPDVRAVLLSGSGASFCSGGDVKAFAGAGEGLPAYIKEMATEFHVAVSRFARMDAPVIALVQGVAAGAGMSLICGADLVIAADTAQFKMAYSALGLTPDGGSTYFLARVVGYRRAAELMITNRVLSAAEALAWGLVNEVVSEDELTGRGEELAADLATGPARAFAGIKHLLHAAVNESLESQLEREVRVISRVAHSSDALEGVAAFTTKRAAKFGASARSPRC